MTAAKFNFKVALNCLIKVSFTCSDTLFDNLNFSCSLRIYQAGKRKRIVFVILILLAITLAIKLHFTVQVYFQEEFRTNVQCSIQTKSKIQAYSRQVAYVNANFCCTLSILALLKYAILYGQFSLSCLWLYPKSLPFSHSLYLSSLLEGVIENK